VDVTEGSRHGGVSIRPARPDDYPRIVELWRESGLSVRLQGRESESAFSRQVERFGELYLVATDGDRIVGVIFGSHDGRKGWINRLAVLPDHRRSGLASRLVAACEIALAADGIEIIAALIEPENAASCNLFERLGYRNDVPVRYYRKLARPDI
jgi:ribosomal protein S18 acetylase RimI-like enzyme